MSLDARLREGLQRSMSKLESDPEFRLPDAHRRGRRRLLVRRVAVAVSVAASLALVMASVAGLDRSPRRGHQPAATLTLFHSPPAGQQDAPAA